MDKEKIRDYSGPPRPEHLFFENQTLYHLLSYTICPSAGMNHDKTISYVLRSAIYAISEQYIFGIKDMFLHILKGSAQYPFIVNVYAPWIQKVINRSMNTMYQAKGRHKCFIPLIRDTMQAMEDLTSGKSPTFPQDYHKKFYGPQLPQHDRMFSPQPRL